MRVAASADGVRQQHAVQPAVDDAVAWTQGHTAAGHDEVRQGVVGVDVDRLRIGRGVAERLHDQVSGEAQASQVLQLVAGHRASGVLGAHGSHLRLAVGARAHALAFRQTAGATDHLLCQGEAFAAVRRSFRLLEQGGRRQAQLGTRFLGEAAANDQRNAAAGTDFVQQDFGLQLEGGDDFIGTVLADLASVGIDVDHVAHGQVGAVELDRQGASVFHGVVEDRGDLGAEAEAASALVRNEGDVVAEEPQHRVGGGLARRTGADHVTDVGNREALGFQLFHLLDRTDGAGYVRVDAVASHFQHGQSVQRDVRARPGIRSRRQVVGVGFASDLEDGQGDLFGNRRAVGEPLAFCPGLHDGLGVLVAGLGLLGDVMEGVEHQQGVLQLLGGDCAQFRAVQQLDQGGDVVAALHGAQQFDGTLLAQQRRRGFALGQGGQEAGLDVGSLVDARGDAVGDQVNEECFFARWRVLQQFDQAGGLFGVQRLGHNALGGTLFYVFAIGFKHSFYPHHWSLGCFGTRIRKLFSKFYAGGRGRMSREQAALRIRHVAGSNCARDALKTASCGLWRQKRRAESSGNGSRS